MTLAHAEVVGTGEGDVRFSELVFSREHGYCLGIETDSGCRYLSIPVSNGLVDYEEYYELAEPEFVRFVADPLEAARFAASCRAHERDDRLLQQPGGHRGTPV